MSLFDEQPRYRTFLLTFWEERGLDPEAPVLWRFQLEDPRTGQMRGFADLDALMEGLERETGNESLTEGSNGHDVRS